MNKEKFIDIALSNEIADLVIKNAKIVDVFNGRIIEGTVAISEDIIIGIGNYEGKAEYDANGAYLMPGFIDSHVHIESSMVTPAEYARVVIPKGVTTAICDPHEIANVCGIDGVKFMMDNARNVPLDFKFMLPSCVPAAPFEDAGAVFTAADTKEYLEKYDFLGLAEMMNYPGVLFKDGEVMTKISASNIVDGHAPGVSGKELSAYAGLGICSDHECTTPEEMEEKISAGMYALLRCGRMSREFTQMASKVNKYNASRVTFCTDDRNLSDIIESGTIQNCIVTANSVGMDIYDAIRAASLNAAQCYKLDKLGAIAPGYKADLVLATDICPKEIIAVWKSGVIAYDNAELKFKTPEVNKTSAIYESVNIAPFSKEELICEFSQDKPVISIEEGSLQTRKIYRNTKEGLSHLAVIERHKKTGKIGTCYVDNYGIKNGAIASCIGHDSHNVTVVGDSADDMAIAVNHLGKNGGIAVVSNGKLLAKLELPVAGLMSDKSANDVVAEHNAIDEAAKALDINPNLDPFMTLAFLSLPVIPELRLTARGLFDVTNFDFI
ncbi:MAG: adenine deaminase [Eubacteriales bacterium]|nr:adenine deaminase [Eubacteriales bacterium]